MNIIASSQNVSRSQAIDWPSSALLDEHWSLRARVAAHIDVDGDGEGRPALGAAEALDHVAAVPFHAVLPQLLLRGEHHEFGLQALRVVAREVLLAKVPCAKPNFWSLVSVLLEAGVGWQGSWGETALPKAFICVSSQLWLS